MHARWLAWVALLAGCSAAHEVGIDAGRPSTLDASLTLDAPTTDAWVDLDAADPVSTIPESVAAPARGACAYARGAMPWDSLGIEVPKGRAIPIDHFVILMQESRSFDAYFGTMRGVDGLPAGAANPADHGAPVQAFHASQYCIDDTRHDWNAAHAEWHGGANDGFVTANDPGGARAMGHLEASDLPYYHWLASTFATSDRHFASALAPTWVNREYALAATSFGRIDNSVPDEARTSGASGDRFILQSLDRAGVSWGIYYETVPAVWGFFPSWATAPEHRTHMRHYGELANDLRSGDVPSVIWVEPSWTNAGTTAHDEHPPADPQLGQAWVREVVEAVMASPIWSRTAIVLTHSQSGGFYDHVPPPTACPPGDYPPLLAPTDAPGDFDRLGFRVPLVVISPYARPGYVSHEVTDHASILRLIEARFRLPALTARDANAWPLLDMFDFAHPWTASPAPSAPIDEAQRAACMAGL